ncbi:hypothetical protein RIF29_07951 [Crotalaria pallida]|uniref:Uncharacterized protein n=1 Tax=Crotalaria pallida TaxID=3830 RepID=A0AAN9PC89_CROPI
MGGEIDTKPIDSVQTALSFFGDKGDQKKYQLMGTGSKRDCEKELADLTKELANCKVQLEAKHGAHMQALLKLENNQKMTHELSTLLRKSDIERNKYMNEYAEGKARIDELESKMAEQNLETAKVRDQLSHVLSELKATQRELLSKETELVAARDSELNALTNAEKLENALKIEKEHKEELLQQLKELNHAIHSSKFAAINAEKEMFAMLSEKDEEIELAIKATAKAQKQLEDMRKQLEMMQELENQLMEKSTQVDSLSLELKKLSDSLILPDNFASSAINNSNQFHIDMEQKERKIMDKSVYIEALETELNLLKQELTSAKEEINGLNTTIESLTSELKKAKAEVNMKKERDIEAQVEIALLKSRLQEHRLLAYNDGYVTEIQPQNPSEEIEEAKEKNNENNNNDHITISLEDYNYLVREAEKANEIGSKSELALMKKELENASAKIAELRARAEQALSRAELAENAKAALEDKIRRHREQRQKRRAAITALKEESTPKPFSPSTSYGTTPKTYQPLGKVLNMKL